MQTQYVYNPNLINEELGQVYTNEEQIYMFNNSQQLKKLKLISLCPESIIPFDANGLYATVMSDLSIMFPDINSYKFIENSNNLQLQDIIANYKHFIIECSL